MVMQFVRVQVNSNLFQAMPKMVAFGMHSFVHQIMIVAVEFVAAVNVRLLAEIKMIAPMENIVRIINV